MADKKIRKFSKTNRRRLLVVFLFVLICFVLLVVRLVQINVKNGTDYEKNVLSLLNYDGQTIPYKRGDITDRNKTVLATSEKIYNLVLDPYVITHSNIDKASEYAKEVLEEYFSISKDDVDTILTQQPDSRYVVLKRKMTYDEKKPYDDFLASEDENDAQKIKAVSSGIWFEESYQRIYPFSTLACDLIGFTASQIRQDLNNFGGFGQQGYGYNVKYLYTEIGKILGLEEEHGMIIIGAGNLGHALANHAGFEKRGFVLKGIFDVNPTLKGMTIRGVPIYMMDELEDFMKNSDIEIGILTIPKAKAIEVANQLVDYGIKAIWNFAHTDLNLPDNVIVENVHLSESLMRLSYNISRYNEEHRAEK